LSSAILYLAIIAIWACVLVPRWIHRPHRVPEADELPGLQYVGVTEQPDSGPGHASVSGDAPPAAWATAAAATASAATASAAVASAAVASAGPGDGRDEDDWIEAGDSPAAQPPAAEESVAWHRVTRSYHSEHQLAQRHQVPLTPGRARILQARRRLLTMLVTLALAALACTAANLAPWWILVPPVGMLGMYVLVLREAAHADAEQAAAEQGRWLAQEQATEEDSARLHARRARQASRPQPTAEIIDISARVTDQLYDQYADAAVRAVGD
jgi:hypothetical protein